MRQIFHIYGEMNREILDQFIQLDNELEKAGKECITVIYLNSFGGETAIAEAFKDIINSKPKAYRLIATGDIESCAFTLFFNARCERTVLDTASGMLHHVGRNIKIDGVMNHFDSDQMNDIFDRGTKLLEWCKENHIPKSKIDRINQAEDVFFNTEELREILKNQIENHGNKS